MLLLLLQQVSFSSCPPVLPAILVAGAVYRVVEGVLGMLEQRQVCRKSKQLPKLECLSRPAWQFSRSSSAGILDHCGFVRVLLHLAG